MPTINWACVRSNPVAALEIAFTATWRTVLVLLRRLIIPFPSQTLSLRNAVARAWISATFHTKGDILYCEPSNHCEQRLQGPGFEAFVIPRSEPVTLKSADAVIIWCHGGGMIFGHPLQYTRSYLRWADRAKQRGKRIAFLALRYPLSSSKKWPAQKDSLIHLYEWVLSQGVPTSRVVFAGDSAGCDLVYLTLMSMRDAPNTPKPLPSCVVSVSPWLDWTGAQTKHSPNQQFDFLVDYDASLQILNDTLRPTELEFDSPQISALLAEDVGGLPPQLVFWSQHEVLGSDGERWVQRSRDAGVDVVEHNPRGEMHTYAMGWPITGASMQEECDDMLVDFVLEGSATK